MAKIQVVKLVDRRDIFRKLLQFEPDNLLYQKLAKMEEPQESREPVKLMRLPEIEEENPKEAGRMGECDIALEVLLEFYPNGEPYRLTTDGRDFAHVFLMFKGQPMDIYGMTTIEEMGAYFQDMSLKPEPVSMQSIRHHFKNNRLHDEVRRYRSLFRNYILSNIGKLFPSLESAGK